MSSQWIRNIAAAFFLALPLVALSPAIAGDPPVKSIEDFSKLPADAFPEGWKCSWRKKAQAEATYKVRHDSQSYLSARAVKSSVPIAKEFKYDPAVYPFLNWQWRVAAFPTGADERYKKTGDSAAAIYVIFAGWFRPDNIKYVWSASLPTGTVTNSPYSGKTKIVVLRNRSTPVETWVCERVNVYEDYKRLFGHEPGKVKAIGIMTDSDNTKSVAEADYRGLQISRK